MKRYIKDGKVIAEGNAIDHEGVTYFNPTASRYESCGWVEYIEPTHEETLEEAIASKVAEIDEYDVSDNVNSCAYNGMSVWMDKDTRSYVRGGVEAMMASGEETYPLWLNDMCITLPCATLVVMLTQLETYAVKCYNVTAQHKANVRKLTDIDSVKAYDFTSDYPNKLEF